jgi:lysophospholipase L1-like esterase
VQLVSTAESGATSGQVTYQLTQVPDNKSGDTLVTVSLGGNDLLGNYQALITTDGLAKVEKQIFDNLLKVKQHFADKTRYPGKVTILIFNVYDPTDDAGLLPADANVEAVCASLISLGPIVGPVLRKQLAQYNANLHAFAKQNGLIVADIYAAFLGHGFHFADTQATCYDASDPTLWFARDCIHPNDAGHHALPNALDDARGRLKSTASRDEFVELWPRETPVGGRGLFSRSLY